MAIIHKKAEKTTNKSPEKKFKPFDKENKITPLKLLVVVVASGHGDAIVEYLKKVGVSAAFITSGEGTGLSNYSKDGFGINGSRKQVVWALVSSYKIPQIKTKLKERFSISRASAGMALTVKLDSLAGVSLYKFFTGTGMVEGVNKNGK